MLPCRHRRLRMLCMARALLPRLISLHSATPALLLTRQQQDTADDVAIGLPCMCLFIGHHAVLYVFSARTLGLKPQPAVGKAQFLAAGFLKASSACLLPLPCQWLPSLGSRLTSCTGPACDGLRWVALLMSVFPALVWRLRRACSARHMMHRLCAGKYRRRRLKGGNLRDWRLALQRKSACSNCQSWTLACMLCATCCWVRRDTRLLRGMQSHTAAQHAHEKAYM